MLYLSRGGWWRSRALLSTCFLFLAAFVFFLAPPSAITQAEDGSEDAAKKVAPRTYALLIGCTNYPKFKARFRARINLQGCLNDVLLMEETLIKHMGVHKEDIVSLAGWPDDPSKRPTEANIRAALAALAKRTYAEGDRVIVHYSGHGVQQPDNGADEVDRLDEAWLVSDGRRDKQTAFAGTLRDEEIGTYLRTMRDHGATVWCIMDCCHSATGMRGAPAEERRTRGISPAALGIDVVPASTPGPAEGDEDSPMDDATEGTDRLVVFYAAQSHQEVPEVRVPKGGADAKYYGLLTTALVKALSSARGQLTFGELYEQVLGAYRSLGWQHAVQPLAEGDLAQRVFGGERADGVPIMLRKGYLGDTKRRTLELTAGALRGLSRGTELAVYDLGSHGESRQKHGTVKIDKLRAATARVKVLAGTDDAWARAGSGPWAVEISKFVLGKPGLPLSIVGKEDQPIPFTSLSEDVQKILEDPYLRACFPRDGPADGAKWTLVTDAQGLPIEVRPALRGGASASFAVGTASLKRTLSQIYRAENLLKLSSRDPMMGRLPGGLQVTVRRKDRNGRLVRPGQVIPPGSLIDVHLTRKRSSRRRAEGIDVFVFWLDPHYGIRLLYPENRHTPRLTKDAVFPIHVWGKDDVATSDESVGLERLLVFAAPQRIDARLDLFFLEQPPLEAANQRGDAARRDDAIAQLLSEFAGHSATTRSTGFVDRGATSLGMQVFTFETRWDHVRIPKASLGQAAAHIERTPTQRAAGAPPDAWDFGPDIHLGQAGVDTDTDTDKTWCLLIGRDENSAHVLVDLDGSVSEERRTSEGLAKMVKEKAFRAEIAIRHEGSPRRTIVWYDVDYDGTFDLVLIDSDRNHRADERYRRTDSGWVHDRDIDVPLLSTGHFTWLRAQDKKRNWGAREKAIERLFTLAGD